MPPRSFLNHTMLMMNLEIPFVTVTNVLSSVDRDDNEVEGYIKIITVMILIIIATTGLLGNALVILAVALSRRLQNVAHIYVVTLAATDFLNAFNQIIHVGVLLSPPRISDVHRACALVGMLIVIFFGNSIGILVLIAINRLQVIAGKINAQTQSWKKAMTSIVIWFLLVSVTTGIVSRTEGIHFGKNHGMCSYNNGSYLDLALAIIMSLCLVVVCYVKIFLHVRRHFHQVSHIHKKPSVVSVIQQERARSSSISIINLEAVDQLARSDRRRHSLLNNPWNLENPRASIVKAEGRGLDEVDNNNDRDRWNKESQITINMFLVVLTFVACVLPASCLLFVPGMQNEVGVVAFLLLLSNSCWNPVIYAWKHPDFKHTFKCIARGKLSEIKDPAQWLRFRLNNIR